MDIELAKRLYPGCQSDPEDTSWFSSPCSYDPIIEHFGAVVVKASLGSYQGDTYAVLREGEQYAYLQFGWGSCSGCDALQACDSYEDIARLIESFETLITWQSKAELLRYFQEHDWEGDYVYHEEEHATFRAEVIAALS